jgi:hypothetical protein
LEFGIRPNRGRHFGSSGSFGGFSRNFRKPGRYFGSSGPFGSFSRSFWKPGRYFGGAGTLDSCWRQRYCSFHHCSGEPLCRAISLKFGCCQQIRGTIGCQYSLSFVSLVRGFWNYDSAHQCKRREWRRFAKLQRLQRDAKWERGPRRQSARISEPQ